MSKLSEKIQENKIKKLTSVNERLVAENQALKDKLAKLELDSNDAHRDNIYKYEAELQMQLEEISALKAKYRQLVDTSADLVDAQKKKYTKQTNKAIKDFTSRL